MTPEKITWRGFEAQPRGSLLQQTIEETPNMGIAYERGCNFYKDFHRHDRPIFIFPRNSCFMEVETKNPKKNYLISNKYFLNVPEHIEHSDEGTSSIYDTFALLPERRFILAIALENGFKKREVEHYLDSPVVLKTEKFLDYLLSEYFFCRVVEKKINSKSDLLEKNIILEIINLALNKEPTGKRDLAFNSQETSFIRALKYIEANLFFELNIKIIIKEIGIGQATLFREFKKQLNCTPYSYIKNRRLEEAKMLLERGRNSVGEVSVLVGYSNFGAFTEAFTHKYKKNPSRFLNKTQST